ncbi:MAG TPA: tRNA lysidine(34) synthetase TilS [Polyangia bacterium]|nr:tRNA lysidine(34) synthetase TilS [Polyangia bacterium]
MLKTIRREQLLGAGDRVLVGVSGGPDSMALLAVLWELAGRLEIHLEVATVDHGLRPEARGEADLVASRAAALNVPFHRLQVDVRAARSATRGGSLQAVARTLRLDALENLAGMVGAARVALAHHADDQAETILFRVLRGTGVRGLAGIPYRRGLFIRPLLDVRRNQIETYLRRRSLPFVQDPSNLDSRFARARMRHRWLPLLREENPRLAEALVALGADARRLASPNGVRGIDPAHVGRAAAATIRQLQRRGGTAVVDVAGGRIEVAYGQTRWRAAADAPRTLHPTGPVSIATEGMFWLGGPVGIEIKEGSAAPSSSSSPSSDSVAFDADQVPTPLVLRQRRPGDRMRPRGGRGSRKVSDLLIDAKIARPERASLPVLTAADDTILYVPGLRPSEVGRPDAETRRWVYVRTLRKQDATSV